MATATRTRSGAGVAEGVTPAGPSEGELPLGAPCVAVDGVAVDGVAVDGVASIVTAGDGEAATPSPVAVATGGEISVGVGAGVGVPGGNGATVGGAGVGSGVSEVSLSGDGDATANVVPPFSTSGGRTPQPSVASRSATASANGAALRRVCGIGWHCLAEPPCPGASRT